MRLVVLSVLAACAAAAPADAAQPATATGLSNVKAIVSFLQDLLKEVKASGAEEETVYKKYVCWVHTTVKQKIKDIEDNHKESRERQREVSELKASIAADSNEVNRLEAAIKNRNEIMKLATEERQKTNQQNTEHKAELESLLNTIEKAKEALAGKKGLIQTDRLRDAVSLSSVDGERLRVLSLFLDDSKSFLQTRKPGESSDMIQGILTQMWNDFASELQTTNREELDAQDKYEKLMEDNTKLNEKDAARAAELKEKIASALEQIATKEANIQELQRVRAEDVDFLFTVQKGANGQKDLFSANVASRTDEIKALDEALKILDDQSNQDKLAIGSVEGNFIQERSVRNDQLKRRLRQVIPHRFLGALLGKDITDFSSHKEFKKLFDAIDKMIVELKKEFAEDTKQRDDCIKTTHDNSKKLDEHKWAIDTLALAIKRLEDEIAEREALIAQNAEDQKDNEANQKALQQQSKDDRTQYAKDKGETEEAMKIVKQAIDKLTAFYHKSLIQAEPAAFDVGEKQAPGGIKKFSEAKGGDRVIELLQQLHNDFQRTLDDNRQRETDSMKNADDLINEAKGNMDTLKATRETLQQEKLDLEKEKQKKEGEKTDEEKGRDDTQKVLDDIKPNCDWILNQFESRTAKRDAEIDGLEKAKGLLAQGY
jgi:septal ring factor EnvC (AmiA/AmiB activator)